MANERYTHIDELVNLMGERHVANCAVERSGAAITDADVIDRVNEVIEVVSRELDGYLRGHVAVPFEDYATGNVPIDVEVMVRGYVAYRLWARRGRFDKDNPHYDEKSLFFQRVRDIQTGRWRFETVSGDEVAEKPVEYEEDRELGDVDREAMGRVFTDTSLKDFTDPH